jgi:hypothetical protein
MTINYRIMGNILFTFLRKDITMRFELELRHMRVSVIMDVLAQAGATPTGERTAEGEGWQAEMIALEPATVGSTVSIRRDLLVIEGDNETLVTSIYNFVRKNMIRGGG